MLNAVRHEPFPLNICFEGDMNAVRDFRLDIVQGGRVRLSREKSGARFADENTAFVVFSGAETARLQARDPAWAQLTVMLIDGERLHSEAREINVVDVLTPR